MSVLSKRAHCILYVSSAFFPAEFTVSLEAVRALHARPHEGLIGWPRMRRAPGRQPKPLVRKPSLRMATDLDETIPAKPDSTLLRYNGPKGRLVLLRKEQG
jgi:hypothetical protein